MMQTINCTRLSEDLESQKEIARKISKGQLKEVQPNPMHQLEEVEKRAAEERGQRLLQKYNI